MRITRSVLAATAAFALFLSSVAAVAAQTGTVTPSLRPRVAADDVNSSEDAQNAAIQQLKTDLAAAVAKNTQLEQQLTTQVAALEHEIVLLTQRANGYDHFDGESNARLTVLEGIAQQYLAHTHTVSVTGVAAAVLKTSPPVPAP